MTRQELLARITVDAGVCFGKPCVRGTRIWVALILDNLAAGTTQAELLTAYPELTPMDLGACLAYAAELARERIMPAPVPDAA